MRGLACRCALPLILNLCATAQGIYNNANSSKDGVCPLIQRDKTDLELGAGPKAPAQSGMVLRNAASGEVAAKETGSSTTGLTGATAQVQMRFDRGDHFFARGQRKDVSRFTAYDAKASGTSIASLSGKVVLVGLWSTRCDPSAKMLMELAKVYPKADSFKFQILAVNFDLNQQDTGEGSIEGGWRAINKFLNRNRSFFSVSGMPMYVPGLGKEGASNFMDIVESLPALFVIDRTGHLSAIHIGYKEGFVGEALKQALLEKPLASVEVPQSPHP